MTTSDGSRRGGARGGIATPEKKMSTFFLLFVVTVNTVSLTFCPLRKKIAQDLQDDDIINGLVANDKHTGLLFCFKLLALVTWISCHIRMYAWMARNEATPQKISLHASRATMPPVAVRSRFAPDDHFEGKSLICHLVLEGRVWLYIYYMYGLISINVCLR